MIKSQDDLNEQGRQSDVLIKAIEKCERLEKEIKDYRSALMAIEIHTAALGGDEKEMVKALLDIDDICRDVLEK